LAAATLGGAGEFVAADTGDGTAKPAALCALAPAEGAASASAAPAEIAANTQKTQRNRSDGRPGFFVLRMTAFYGEASPITSQIAQDDDFLQEVSA
jgi:hypothetical protein